MTTEQVKEIVQKENARINPTYDTLEQVPDYWREDIRALMDRGILQGSGGKLGLTRSEAKGAVLVKRGLEKAGLL